MSYTKLLKRYCWSMSWLLTATGCLLVIFFVFDASRGYDENQLALIDAVSMETPCRELPQVTDSVACWSKESASREDIEEILREIRAEIDETRAGSGDISQLATKEYALVQRLQVRIARHDASMNLWLTSWALFAAACVGVIALVWLSFIPKIYRHLHRGRLFSLIAAGAPFAMAFALVLAATLSEGSAKHSWLLGLLALGFLLPLSYHSYRYWRIWNKNSKNSSIPTIIVAFASVSAVGVAWRYLERPEPVWLCLVLLAAVLLSTVLYKRNLESNSWRAWLFGLLWVIGFGVTVSWATSSDWFIYPSLERAESISSPNVRGLVSFHNILRDAAIGLIVGFVLLLTWPSKELQADTAPMPKRREDNIDPQWALQYVQSTSELGQKLQIVQDRTAGLQAVLYAGAVMIGLGIVELGFLYDLYQTRDPRYAVMVNEIGRASKASVGAIFSLLLAGGYLLAAIPLGRWLDEIRQRASMQGIRPDEWHVIIQHYQLQWARDLFSLPRLTILSSPALIGLTDGPMRTLLGL